MDKQQVKDLIYDHEPQGTYDIGIECGCGWHEGMTMGLDNEPEVYNRTWRWHFGVILDQQD